MEGRVEADVVMHVAGSYPRGALAPVRVAWRPPASSAEERGGGEAGEVWVWVHPAGADDAARALEEAASSKGSDAGKVAVSRGGAARFELRGPEAGPILAAVLRAGDGVLRRGARSGTILMLDAADPRCAGV